MKVAILISMLRLEVFFEGLDYPKLEGDLETDTKERH